MQKIPRKCLSCINQRCSTKAGVYVVHSTRLKGTLDNTETMITNGAQRQRPSHSFGANALLSAKSGLNILTPDDRSNNFEWPQLVASHLDEDDGIAAQTKQYKTKKSDQKRTAEAENHRPNNLAR